MRQTYLTQPVNIMPARKKFTIYKRPVLERLEDLVCHWLINNPLIKWDALYYRHFMLSFSTQLRYLGWYVSKVNTKEQHIIITYAVHSMNHAQGLPFLCFVDWLLTDFTHIFHDVLYGYWPNHTTASRPVKQLWWILELMMINGWYYTLHYFTKHQNNPWVSA